MENKRPKGLVVLLDLLPDETNIALSNVLHFLVCRGGHISD